jgi:NAD(P) transhydrogenase subunit alpha
MRPAAKEQVQSLGGRFVELPIEAQNAQDARGYGTAQDENFYARQRELLTRVVAESDVVITAAVIPGKKSPVLITEEMVKGMAPGSVIVDLASERGGNCELTRTGETVQAHGVTIIGAINLASSVPYHASQMYARNHFHVLAVHGERGQAATEPARRDYPRDHGYARRRSGERAGAGIFQDAGVGGKVKDAWGFSS